LTLREIHRFVNCLQKTDGFDTWDIDSLEKDIRLGLKKVCNEGTQGRTVRVDVAAGAEAIMKAVDGCGKLDNVTGEAGTNIGGML
ncbi:hypothetical protein MJM04_33160, partial [Salmonella enterica subsp. enterica serovar Cerro]|nr:hypothetical protein [Salmonella enterica subsp. enterica serovar Cerro]